MRSVVTPAKFPMSLDDGLVAKYFGKHPELGRRMRLGLVEAEIAAPRSVFGKDQGTTKVQVGHIVALHHKRRGLWEVHCALEIQVKAIAWLRDHCGERTKMVRHRNNQQKHHSPARWQGNNFI